MAGWGLRPGLGHAPAAPLNDLGTDSAESNWAASTSPRLPGSAGRGSNLAGPAPKPHSPRPTVPGGATDTVTSLSPAPRQYPIHKRRHPNVLYRQAQYLTGTCSRGVPCLLLPRRRPRQHPPAKRRPCGERCVQRSRKARMASLTRTALASSSGAACCTGRPACCPGACLPPRTSLRRRGQPTRCGAAAFLGAGPAPRREHTLAPAGVVDCLRSRTLTLQGRSHMPCSVKLLRAYDVEVEPGRPQTPNSAPRFGGGPPPPPPPPPPPQAVGCAADVFGAIVGACFP